MKYDFNASGRPAIATYKLHGGDSVTQVMSRLEMAFSPESLALKWGAKLVHSSKLLDQLIAKLAQTGELDPQLDDALERERGREVSVSTIPSIVRDYRQEDPLTAQLVEDLVSISRRLGEGLEPTAYSAEAIRPHVAGSVHRVIYAIATELKNELLSRLGKIPMRELHKTVPTVFAPEFIQKYHGAKRTFDGIPNILLGKLYEALGTDSIRIFHSCFAHHTIQVAEFVD